MQTVSLQSDRYRRAVDQINQVMQSNNFTRQEAINLLAELSNSKKEFDLDYICSVLFPECYPPARVPSKFSIPSALFTHRFSIYLTTEATGYGAVSLLPLDTSFCCLYSMDGYDGNSSNAMSTSIKYYPASDSTFISTNYAQARLIGCSMRLQYIGQAQVESGFITAGHVYEAEAGRLSDEIVENGYFLVRSRPSQGARLVWVPKDNSDTEFFDTNLKIVDGGAGSNNVFNGMTELGVPASGTTTLKVAHYQGTDWQDSSLTERPIPPMLVWGQGSKKLQSSFPTQLVMTWRGLPTNQTWWRIDVERHFEGVPRSVIRDLVSVAKPKANEKSLNAIKKLSEADILFGQKIEQFDQLKAQFTSSMADTLSSLASDDVIPSEIDLNLKYAESGKRTRVYTTGEEFATGVKRLKDSDDIVYKALGQSILQKVVGQDFAASTTMSIDGINIPVHIGLQSKEYGQMIKAFPQLYGKSKTKMYDGLINLTKSNDASVIPLVQQYQQQGENIVNLASRRWQAQAPNFVKLLTPQNIWESVLEFSPRLRKSLIWYKISGRTILNAKVQLTLHTGVGETVVAVDYDEILYKDQDKGTIPLQDRLVFIKNKRLSEAFNELTVDTKDLHENLSNNVITNPDLLQQYKAEYQSRAKALVDSLAAAGQDYNYNPVKIAYVPFVKKLLIMTTAQASIPFSITVKFTYKIDTFEPFLQYVYQKTIPYTVYGDTSMFTKDGSFKPEKVEAENKKQMNILKSSFKKISKLNHVLSKKDLFDKIYRDYIFAWEFMLEDYQAINQANPTPDYTTDLGTGGFYQFRAYNKGMLRTYQQMFMSDPSKFREQTNKIQTMDQFLVNLSQTQLSVLERVTYNLLLAYNSRQQGGASDQVTFVILKALIAFLKTKNKLNSVNQGEIRQPRSDNSRDKGYRGQFINLQSNNGPQYMQNLLQQQNQMRQGNGDNNDNPDRVMMKQYRLRIYDYKEFALLSDSYLEIVRMALLRFYTLKKEFEMTGSVYPYIVKQIQLTWKVQLSKWQQGQVSQYFTTLPAIDYYQGFNDAFHPDFFLQQTFFDVERIQVKFKPHIAVNQVTREESRQYFRDLFDSTDFPQFSAFAQVETIHWMNTYSAGPMTVNAMSSQLFDLVWKKLGSTVNNKQTFDAIYQDLQGYIKIWVATIVQYVENKRQSLNGIVNYHYKPFEFQAKIRKLIEVVAYLTEYSWDIFSESYLVTYLYHVLSGSIGIVEIGLDNNPPRLNFPTLHFYIAGQNPNIRHGILVLNNDHFPTDSADANTPRFQWLQPILQKLNFDINTEYAKIAVVPRVLKQQKLDIQAKPSSSRREEVKQDSSKARDRSRDRDEDQTSIRRSQRVSDAKR